jgi:zinc transport system substrate-binding protein
MKIISVKGWRRALGGTVTVVLLLLTPGCATTGHDGAQGSSPGELQIVTSFYPLQFVASRVAGKHATVSNLTAPGAEPHDLELTPRQVASVTRADLVLYEKSFQPAVDEAVAQSGNPHVLDTTTVVPLQPLPHVEGPTQGPLAESRGGLDPHVWLDPTMLALITRAVGDQLAGIDPAHRGDYASNASALIGDFGVLDRAYVQGLRSCRRTQFVTTHAAFGYLSRRYGLQQIAFSGLSPDSEPSPARVAAVQAAARRFQLTTIFYETLVSPAVAEAVAGDLGLRTDVLDPVEGLTKESRGSDYLGIMRSNLAALREANQCR